MEEIVLFILDVVFGGLFLLAAAKLTGVDLVLRETILCVTAAALVSLIPAVGWLASIIVLFYLLKHFSQANVWPDLIFMVVISRLLTVVAVMALASVI